MIDRDRKPSGSSQTWHGLLHVLETIVHLGVDDSSRASATIPALDYKRHDLQAK